MAQDTMITYFKRILIDLSRPNPGSMEALSLLRSRIASSWSACLRELTANPKCRRKRVVLGVCDGEEYASNAELLRAAGGFAGECDDWLPQVVGKDLHVGPGDLSAPTGTNDFENRFLGSPSP